MRTVLFLLLALGGCADRLPDAELVAPAGESASVPVGGPALWVPARGRS
jgi:hypothetical protein